MACELLDTCPLLNQRLASKPALAELYKVSYCRGKHEGCARYVVQQARGAQAVPADLFPNEADRARELIAWAEGEGWVPRRGR